MIAGVLLAAGTGGRFGADKLRAPLADGRAVGEAAAATMVAGLADVVAVVRPGDTAVAAMLRAAGCAVVVCDRAPDGMGASLACGVGARPGADGWVVALADMPWIEPATITAIAARLAEGARIVAPVHAGRRGHPVGFAAELRADLLALGGDRGARGILEANRHRLELVDTGDPGVVHDVDTPADLQRDPRAGDG